MRAITLLAFCVAAVTAVPQSPERIIGGHETTIDNYPEVVLLLFASNQINFRQNCGGSILNQRSILTAAHCVLGFMDNPPAWRIRVGSSYASSGGVLHTCAKIIRNPNHNTVTRDSDIAIMHTVTPIVYSKVVQPARIAGPNYHLADNQVVWAVGWGVIEQVTWTLPEQLHHVQVWTVNQELCNERYGGREITDNMLCIGWLDVDGRGTCRGDSGSPVFHNGVVVGLVSFGRSPCAQGEHPAVNVRVSRFISWIQENA
ncbi:trypsin, alkaline A-like isoform X2 [Anticarsia gemmatalis]|uniref:trypsin, alkaline A-like isoform X2 n=1 Tax=Anticarsia gemmatalis TaxID=129554 RepID=UPI003F760B74